MENCLGGQMATGSCGQSCRGVTGGGRGHGDRGAGRGPAVLFRPQLNGYLLVRPELRNGPNMNRRNISRWRTATKTQFNFNTMTFMLNFGRYVLVSKSSNCSFGHLVHQESSRWRNFHFHSENFT
jgi:hypothetical protein